MNRFLRSPQPAALALLAACYALPERHALSSETSGVDAGSAADAEGELDGEASAGDGSQRDAAANGCRCGEAKPICIEATKTCVACTADDDGACAADQVCDVLRGECVECLKNPDCRDPSESVCDETSHTCQPCAESSTGDCSHIAGKQVCLAGDCVECTKDKLAACTVLQSNKTVQNACHAREHTCTERELRKTPPCGECVSDAQCMAGHVCVEMAFGGQPIAGKWYCQPVREGLNCSGQRPYGVLASGAVTIEGEVADICTLRTSSCSSQSHYLKKYCGLDQDDRPIVLDDAGVPVAPSVKGDNTLCGLSELDDGFCVEAQPGLHRCTVPCVEVQDCPRAAPTCVQQTHAAGMADLCTVL